MPSTDDTSSAMKPEAGSGPRTVRAPRGTTISCKGWQQEAAMRMLMNNLDPDVAERPNDLVVYGGSGRAARSWAAFDAIVRSLQSRFILTAGLGGMGGAQPTPVKCCSTSPIMSSTVPYFRWSRLGIARQSSSGEPL